MITRSPKSFKDGRFAQKLPVEKGGVIRSSGNILGTGLVGASNGRSF